MELCINPLPVLLLLLTILHFGTQEININITEFDICSCDMTGRACDISCCCDKDCSQSQLDSFSCHHKPKENLHGIRAEWKCSNMGSHSAPYFSQFLCIERENSPLIGYFYPNFPVVKDLPTLNDILKMHTRLEDERRRDSFSSHPMAVKSLAGKGYVFGQDLVVVPSHLQTAKLLVPYSTYSSSCDSIRSVQYLNNIRSSCLVNVRRSCGTPLLNAKSYVVGTADRRILGSPEDDKPLQNVTRKFYYVTEPCCYLQSKKCVKHICNGSVVPVDDISLESYMGQNTCHSSIISVTYLFAWKGGRILSTEMYVVLANISLHSDTDTLSQTFTVQFKYVKNDIERSATNQTQSRKITVLGYRHGDSVVGVIHNNSTLAPDEVENKTSFTIVPLLMWNNDASGSCLIGEKPVLFGKDRLSGCSVQVKDWRSKDCSDLRKFVMDKQLELLKVDFLSASGSLEDEDFIEIEESELPSANDTNDDQWTIGCDSIPHHVNLHIAYTEVIRTREQPFYKILAVTRSYNMTKWSPSGKLNSSVHPIYSSVQFKFVNVEKVKRLQRTKKYWLPTASLDQCTEETCCRGILYPLTADHVEDASGHLHQAMDTLFFIAILVASAGLLLRTKIHTRRNS